ncbi:tail assembly protein [Pantoea dispersa]|uniref:tail assembly protein n=1 Tax=Pantoea dispersa TaxID=59814 RepID=UPI0023AA1427|nr:tail assembly protein [Pantoea dispersa]WEA07655.1 tail assembly protein [Pantoea dispersa]
MHPAEYPSERTRPVRVCLYGSLARSGRRIDLHVSTAAEALHALVMQSGEFRRLFSEGLYQVRIAGSDADADTLHARLHERLPDGAVIHLVPRLQGASRRGLLQLFAGAALIAASFIPGLNAFAWTVGATTLSLSGAAFSLGASLMLGGAAQLLAPRPAGASAMNDKSTWFSGTENMTAQGAPVPVLYGEMRVGSRVISQEIATRDMSGVGKVIVIGH